MNIDEGKKICKPKNVLSVFVATLESLLNSSSFFFYEEDYGLSIITAALTGLRVCGREKTEIEGRLLPQTVSVMRLSKFP